MEGLLSTGPTPSTLETLTKSSGLELIRNVTGFIFCILGPLGLPGGAERKIASFLFLLIACTYIIEANQMHIYHS